MLKVEESDKTGDYTVHGSTRDAIDTLIHFLSEYDTSEERIDWLMEDGQKNAVRIAASRDIIKEVIREFIEKADIENVEITGHLMMLMQNTKKELLDIIDVIQEEHERTGESPEERLQMLSRLAGDSKLMANIHKN